MEPPTDGATSTPGPPLPPAADSPQREIELESLLRQRAPRRRLLQGIAVAAVLLVLAAAVTHAVVSESSPPGVAAIPTATPIPLGPVLVRSNISPAMLTLNGRQLGTPPLVTTFHRGMNT